MCVVLSGAAVLSAPITQAGAGTITYTGHVFASVGNGTVNIYDAGSGNLLSTLNDGTNEPYTAGGAFDAQGDFYVTDDVTGGISRYDSSGNLLPPFASGLSNPLSLVFDGSGNLYVGQQTAPYVAEFSPSGVRQPDIGPMQTELYGADWIDLAADQCTLYYTTEGTDILRFNKCTNAQLPNFNAAPFTGAAAYEMRIRPNGQVLVADSNNVILLNAGGSVMQSYSCASLPGCAGQLFAVNLDPNGTSFWTGDSYSGNIWQVDIASGQVLQTISTGSGVLYGLTVNGEINVATSSPAPPPPATTTLSPTSPTAAVDGQPITLSAVLTSNVPTAGTPVAGQTVVLTLGSGITAQSCTATTNSSGAASCVIGAVQQPGNAPTITGTFSGSTGLLPSGSSSSVLLGRPPAAGAFVIGDVSAGNPTAGIAVNFWGSQLWKTNVFSGGSAPASMKGYVDHVSRYGCGATFTTSPGNSSAPPASIPGQMAVIVSSHISKSGSTISGTIVHIVIVHVNAGYGPNPGHDGTGTILATVC
jgi:hypothetical protein